MSIITLTINGTVAPNPHETFGPDSIDHGGYFGPVGASLAGDPFTVTWAGIDCNCAGTTSFNPIIDAVLTINGTSFDFGSGGASCPACGGTSYVVNDFFTNLQQVSTSGSNFTSLTTNDPNTRFLPPDEEGVFYIHIGNNASLNTEAYLSIPGRLGVPAPVVGDLPGLLAMLIIFGGFYWKRRYAGTSRHDTLPMP